MNMFAKTETPIHELYVIKPKKIEDERGYLSRIYCSKLMNKVGWHGRIAQVNYTKTL